MGWGWALESLLSRVDVVIEVGGVTEGHEKSLPCSEITKCKLLEKLVCTGTAQLWGRNQECGEREGVGWGQSFISGLFQLQNYRILI